MELVYNPIQPNKILDALQCRSILLWGAENLLKERALFTLSNSLVTKEWTAFDLEILNCSNASVDAVIGAASQVPFGSDRRVVILRGAEVLRERNRSADAERLAEKIAALPPSSCLILVAAAGEDDNKRKTAISPKFDAVMKQNGCLVSFKTLQTPELTRWISDYLKPHSKSLNLDAIPKLIKATGGELQRIDIELSKLIDYTNSRDKITSDDVELLCQSVSEDTLFVLVEAVMHRNLDKSLSLLGEMHRHDNNPQAVAGKFLAILGRQIRLIWQARSLAEMGLTPGNVRALPANALDILPAEGSIVQISFKASELFASARNWSYSQLRTAQEKLLLCDLANKGSSTEEVSLFSADVVRNLQLLVIQIANC